MTLRVGFAIVVLSAGASGLWAVSRAVQEPFPHSDHAGLFPLCQGCHEGIETDTEVAYYPTPGSCTACHDGEVEPEIEWTAPVVDPSNLDYSHRIHIEVVAASGGEADCSTCHRLAADSVATLFAVEGREARAPGAVSATETMAVPHMFVGRAEPETCVSCHAHEAPAHLSYSLDCAACHQTLAEATSLSVERIAAFPRPPEHENADFILDHGALEAVGGSACATCHTRDSCERCHANAADLGEIVGLRPDSRVAGLLHDTPAEYPEPEDHDASWLWNHSKVALAQPGGCANCHTQRTCTSCHNEVSNAQVAAMPLPVPGGAQGVEWEGEAPRVHRPDLSPPTEPEPRAPKRIVSAATSRRPVRHATRAAVVPCSTRAISWRCTVPRRTATSSTARRATTPKSFAERVIKGWDSRLRVGSTSRSTAPTLFGCSGTGWRLGKGWRDVRPAIHRWIAPSVTLRSVVGGSALTGPVSILTGP